MLMTDDFARPENLRHHRLEVQDTMLHVAEVGEGRPLLLLHGWPEFWATWLPLMNRLQRHYRLIAPDLRGFGDSAKPDGPRDDVGANRHAADMAALIDRLGLEDVTVVGHDVGAYVSQALARNHPEAVSRLFFFNCPTATVGGRWVHGGQVNEIWYQSFQRLDLAVKLVGASRESCRDYFKHFLTHWSHRKDAFDSVLEMWVDNFMKPGSLQGGFNWYISANAGRLEAIDGIAPVPTTITHPTAVFWGRHDPVLRSEWAEFVPMSFSNATVSFAEDAGHFVHVEAPDEACRALLGFLAEDGGPSS
jgi:epoxide hydrolase 4